MNVMRTMSYTCSECNKKINNGRIFQNNTIYRCGDADVCSITCSRIRLDKIISVDPYLNTPMIWQDIPTTPTIGCFKRVSTMENLESSYFKPNNSLNSIKEEYFSSSDSSINYTTGYDCNSLRITVISLLMNTVSYFTEIINKIFYPK